MQSLAPTSPIRAAQVLSGLPVAERPALWLADRLAQAAAATAVRPTGFAALDAELPGGGWPAAGLTELLLASPGSGELRLLAPLLAQAGHHAGSLLCIAPPFIPYAPALRALCLPLECLVLVTPDSLADATWAAEQGLRSGACTAVLWWQGPASPGRPKTVTRPKALKGPLLGLALKGPPLGLTPEPLPGLAPKEPLPGLGTDAAGAWGPACERSPAAALATALRRLHLAALEGACPLFALRPASARAHSSPAPLRLALEPAAQGQLAVTAFKRRGPAMGAPLLLTLPVAGSPARPALRRVLTPAVPSAPPVAVLPLSEPADAVVRAAPERFAA